MIIGISGYARSGKHEAAKALESDYKVVAFADVLREFLYELNPFVDQYGVRLQRVIDSFGWDGYKDTEFHGEIRRLIQTLGTDCGRSMLGSNIWVDATFSKMNAPHAQNYVIADVRFPNEAKAIRDRGGAMIRIKKPGVVPANNHPSETALDDYMFDYYISNHGSVESLHYSMRHLANRLAKYSPLL